MNFWLLIAFASITIAIFRGFPFFFRHSAFLNNKDGAFYRFLTYSTQAMLGAIVYATAFMNKNIENLISDFALIDGVKFALIAFIFFATIWTNRLLTCFLFALGVFIIFIYGINPID